MEIFHIHSGFLPSTVWVSMESVYIWTCSPNGLESKLRATSFEPTNSMTYRVDPKLTSSLLSHFFPTFRFEPPTIRVIRQIHMFHSTFLEKRHPQLTQNKTRQKKQTSHQPINSNQPYIKPNWSNVLAKLYIIVPQPRFFFEIRGPISLTKPPFGALFFGFSVASATRLGRSVFLFFFFAVDRVCVLEVVWDGEERFFCWVGKNTRGTKESC